MLRRKWSLIAFVFSVSAFLAAFGIAFAATVQVSREISSTVEVISVDVIADDNLKIFHDEEGNNPVTSLEFDFLNLQPPLEAHVPGQTIFVRNDSNVDLKMVEPCETVFVNDDDDGQRIGFVNPRFFTVDHEDISPNDRPCEGDGVPIASGETLMVEIDVHSLESGLPAGSHSFTIVFAGVGEE